MTWLLLCGIGIGAGVFAGMFGIGGGLLIVLALLWVMKFPIHVASAMSLVALSIPLGAVIAVYQYYVAGKITTQHILYGLMICLGLGIGAFFGARWAISMDQTLLRKGFAVFLVFVAVMTWAKA